mgnify:CR=1 FL=1
MLLLACDLPGAGEAVPELLEIKTSIFTTLDGIVREDCVLATNTSSLSITEIAKTTKAYLEYISSQEGQDAAAEAAGSAPLSSAAQESAKSAIGNIKAD